MGRYVTRFQGGGSNSVGATFTAAAGGGNSKFAVAANGQALLRVQYPALAAYYSGQTQFDSLNIVGSVTGSNFASPIGGAISTTPRSNAFGGGEQAATFNDFTVYLQNVTVSANSGIASGYRIWYTQSGIDWKLIDPFALPFTDASFITTSSAVYLCHSSGLYKTTDGLNYTNPYTTGVRGLAELNGVVIFSTGGTGVLTTTDFSAVTGYNIAGFTPQSIVNYSGVLYAFQSGSTSVRFSTNTGQTWSTATSGLIVPSGAGNWARVINNIVMVSTPGTGALYQWSTNPTGTSTTWTALATNKPTAALYGTHFVYDSTDNVLMCGWAHCLTSGTTAGDIFGYRVTGVTGAAIAYTGTVQNVTFAPSLFNGTYAYPLIINTGTVKAFYNDALFTYQPTGTAWQGDYNITLTGTLSGLSSVPFFPLNQFEFYGWGAVGTTNSGRRYIIKGNKGSGGMAASDAGYISYLSAHVEESGFFKPLYATSGDVTGTTANISRVTGITSSAVSASTMLLAEASGQYILAWAGNTALGGRLHYNRYAQSTRTSTGDFISSGSFFPGSAVTGVQAGASKSDGLYLLPTGMPTVGLTTGTLIPASGAARLFSYNISGLTATATFTQAVQFSDVTNEVVLSAYQSGTVTGFTLIFSGGALISRAPYTLFNATGGVVSTLSGTVVLKSLGSYYALDTSGNIYKGSVPSLLTFYGKGVSFPTGAVANFTATRFREVAETKILGPVFFDNEYGNIITQTLTTGATNYWQGNMPNLFSMSSGAFIVQIGATAVSALNASTAGTGAFIVPNIPAPATGEAKYIIAR